MSSLSQSLPRRLAVAAALSPAIPVAVYLALGTEPEIDTLGSAARQPAVNVVVPSASSMPPVPMSVLGQGGILTRSAGIGNGAGDGSHLFDELLDRSRLQARWLESHGFTPGSTALQRLHGLLDGRATLFAGAAQPVAFGPQGGTSPLLAGGVPVLSPHERYIEAALPSGLLGGDSVILRWRNASNDSVIDLSTQTLPSGSNEAMPVWMHSSVDWPPGRYRVEVIAPNPDLSLLAAGEFEIAAPGAAMTPFAFHEQVNRTP